MPDEIAVQLPQQPIQPPKNPKGPLWLVEIGFLEITVVLLFLVLVFGALNFFNILTLSTIFPQLSFLPHLSQSNRKPLPPDSVLKGQLQSFITSTLNPQYILPNLSFIKSKEFQNTITIRGEWTKDTTPVVAQLVVDTVSALPLQENLIISLGSASADLDPTTSQTLLQTYFSGVSAASSSAVTCVTNTDPIKTICQIEKKHGTNTQLYQLQSIGSTRKLFISSCVPLHTSTPSVDCIIL